MSRFDRPAGEGGAAPDAGAGKGSHDVFWLCQIGQQPVFPALAPGAPAADQKSPAGSPCTKRGSVHSQRNALRIDASRARNLPGGSSSADSAPAPPRSDQPERTSSSRALHRRAVARRCARSPLAQAAASSLHGDGSAPRSALGFLRRTRSLSARPPSSLAGSLLSLSLGHGGPPGSAGPSTCSLAPSARHPLARRRAERALPQRRLLERSASVWRPERRPRPGSESSLSTRSIFWIRRLTS